MKRLFVLLLLCFAVINLKGQTQLFGQIDMADLKLTACDFEKNAGAMVLFDKTEVNTVNDITTITRHFPGALPDWNFQGNIPVPYRQPNANISTEFIYKISPQINGEFDKKIKESIRVTSPPSAIFTKKCMSC